MTALSLSGAPQSPRENIKWKVALETAEKFKRLKIIDREIWEVVSP